MWDRTLHAHDASQGARALGSRASFGAHVLVHAQRLCCPGILRHRRTRPGLLAPPCGPGRLASRAARPSARAVELRSPLPEPVPSTPGGTTACPDVSGGSAPQLRSFFSPRLHSRPADPTSGDDQAADEPAATTSTTEATTTTSAPDVPTEDVTFNSADGVELTGRIYGNGTTAIVASHMANKSKADSRRPARSWRPRDSRCSPTTAVATAHRAKGTPPSGCKTRSPPSTSCGRVARRRCSCSARAAGEPSRSPRPCRHPSTGSSPSRSAVSTETSRPTSTVPASTTDLASGVTWRTVPGNSLRTVIERSATTVPMDVVVRRCSRFFGERR